jgi:hypothetical protein
LSSQKQKTKHHPPRRGRQAAPFPYPKLNPANSPLAKLEAAGLILRVRQEIGAPNRIDVLASKKQD